jgi:hypothetical protein
MEILIFHPNNNKLYENAIKTLWINKTLIER